MEKTKVTLHIDRALMDEAQAYAERHNVTVTQLITDYIQMLVELGTPTPEQTPILYELTGILPPNVASEDYQNYLKDKYDK